MYRNQFRAERFDAHTSRRPGRGGGGGCGGGGSAAPAARPRLPSNWSGGSFRRPGSVQRYRPKSPASAVPEGKGAAAFFYRAVESPSHGSPESVELVDVPAQSSSTEVTDALALEPAEGVPDSSSPTRPPKGDLSTAFTLQFGTISPGIINKAQFPPRTISAPPDLDGKKPEQAHHELSGTPCTMLSSPASEQQNQEAANNLVSGGQVDATAKHKNMHVPISSTSSVAQTPVPPLPETPMLPSAPPASDVHLDSCRVLPKTSSSPSQQQQKQEARRDVVSASQSDTMHIHPPAKAKIDVHLPVSYTPSVASLKSFVLPMSGMPLPMAFQQRQPPVPVEFRGPNMPMQSIGAVPGLLPVKMAVPMGNAPHIQPLFVPPQPRALQHQAFIHEGQGLGYLPPASHHLVPQFGNLRITPELSQQQPRSGDSYKNTVKITHPETHEELMLDRSFHSYRDVTSSGQMPLHNVNQPPQHIPIFTPLRKVYNPIQPNLYNPSPIYYPPAATFPPLTSRQFSPRMQAPRHSFDLTNSNQPITSMKPHMLHPSPGANPGPPTHLRVAPEGASFEGSLPSSLSTPVPVVVKPVEKNGAALETSIPTCVVETPTLLRYSGESTTSRQQRDCKIGLEISLGPAKLVSEGACKVPVVAADKSSTTIPQTVSAQQAQTRAALSAHVTQVADSGSISTSNFPSVCTGNGTSSAEAKPVGTEKSPVPAAASSFNAKCELSQIVPLQCEAMPANGASTKINDSTLASTSLGSDADGTLLTNRNSKYVGDGILGKPPVLHIEEILATKIEAPSKSIEGFSKAKVYTVSFLEELSDVDNSVLLENQDEVREEHIGNAKAMCSGSKKEQLDASMPAGICGSESDSNAEKSVSSPHTCPDLANFHSSMSGSNLSPSNIPEESSSPDAHTGSSELESNQNGSATKSADMLEGAALVSDSINSQSKKGLESKIAELSNTCSLVAAPMVHTEKPVLEASKPKTSRGKRKKRKEMLCRADSRKSSDLYNAYNALKEKSESFSTPESICNSSTVDAKQHYGSDDPEKNISISEDDSQSRTELFHWEDAADISTEKLRAPEPKQQVSGAGEVHEGDEDDSANRKKYSRDFLLTFAQCCTDLPIGFEIGFDIVGAVMSVLVAPFIVNCEQYPNHGRVTDRASGASRVDRHMVSNSDGDRWTKSYAPLNPGRGPLPDVVLGPVIANWGARQRVSHGFSRSLSHNQSSSQYTGEILSRAVKAVVSQRSMPRSSVDERLQHGTGVQGVSVPSSRVSMPLMHKAEKKYEVGKVSDEEEAKQRQLKGILNKLTPQNFEKLFAQVKELNIDNVVTLTGVISQIFDKALMEPTFCEMYASFCFCLAGVLPDFVEDCEKITFKRLLLNKCQEEFERGEREQAEADKVEEEGGIKLSKGQREEKRLRARRRMLGNIRLIGELYKKKMLTERIMHECIKKLLGEFRNPDEEDLESLCKLMSTIGEMIDHPRAKEHIDAYFDIVQKLSANPKLSSRIRFMLEDVIDLRKNRWRQRRKVEGPKKIEEVHRDAAKQRLGQSTRLGSSPSYNSSVTSSNSALRLGPPSDCGIRGSFTLASRDSQPVKNFGSSHVRAHGTQDVSLDARYQSATRTLPIPLHQRPTNDRSIHLGPQGDLGRGMSTSEQPLVSNAILPVGQLTSMVSSRNGYDGQKSHNSREGSFTGATSTRANRQESTNTPASRFLRAADHAFPGLVTATHPAGQVHTSSIGSRDTCSKTRTFPEEVLQEKSILTIREFYSAKDEKEVALCMKELNAPDFYPSLVSLWINDSFERKDMERELLAKLLVDLCKSQESLLSQMQLLQGFQSVLSTLEDAVTDAPKAAEFLGRIFGKIVLEDVISLRDIGRLLQEGGEETGHLLERGLASEVLGSTLESIRVEKGDSAMDEIRETSNLRFEDFSHPGVCV